MEHVSPSRLKEPTDEPCLVGALWLRLESSRQRCEPPQPKAGIHPTKISRIALFARTHPNPGLRRDEGALQLEGLNREHSRHPWETQQTAETGLIIFLAESVTCAAEGANATSGE